MAVTGQQSQEVCRRPSGYEQGGNQGIFCLVQLATIMGQQIFKTHDCHVLPWNYGNGFVMFWLVGPCILSLHSMLLAVRSHGNTIHDKNGQP